MLAKETEKPFNHKEWVYEIKWDGYRAIAEVKGNNIKLYSRNGINFSKMYPTMVQALAKMKIDAVLDGEIVALDKDGVSSFQLLQDYNGETPLIYYVFDALYINKKNICSLPLLERKKRLKKIIKRSDLVKYSDHISEKGIQFFELAGKSNIEGIMAKHSDSEYKPGTRSSDWLKIKHHKTREAIIAGYTAPRGTRNYFGSLVLAVREKNKLKYIGQTGGGFNARTLKQVYELLKPLQIKHPAFKGPIKLTTSFTPVKPVLVCEVKFSEITRDGKLRQPVFLRLREDKKAKDVTVHASEMENEPVKNNLEKNKMKTQEPLTNKVYTLGNDKSDEFVFGKVKVKISNRDKLFWQDEGITKGDVIDYYNSISDYILPYLKGRPESLKRNPNGILDGDFYQKDAGLVAPEWVDRKRIFSSSTNKEVNYIICNNKPTLIYLANLGCIELNPWHSTIEALNRPDYMVIDIDPSEKNTFDQVVETALVFREIFDKAGVDSYCKTSGATGIHIYVPMERKYTYKQVGDFAHLLTVLVQKQLSSFTSLERSLAKRSKKHIYLDYLQNRRGQTIASAYCLRPMPGAPVSMPLKWSEVKRGLSPLDFNIHNVLKRLKKAGDIFSGILGRGIDMEKSIEALEV